MTSEILSTLDALAVSTFIDIGKQVDNNGDTLRAEIYYKRALKAAETIYGPLHGETGLVLIRLADFYKRHSLYDKAKLIDERIAEIAELYRADFYD